MLVTGAGGSIASALALRLSAVSPSSLQLLDASEGRLYALEQSWRIAGASGAMSLVLGSIADRTLLDEIFTLHAPRLVFHAAAFKHVPLMETQPLAAIANNIFGTLTLTTSAAAHGARVILLSTDKAVEPASIMGATKRVAERIVLAAGGIVLRLANVLATRDSVTEVFARQIAHGLPLTVTDPAARRYFLTLDEAVNLLLIAAAQPESGTFAPQLPAAHFIADLAHFIANALAPGRPIALDFTSLRPGDKEAELLWSRSECPQASTYADLSWLPADPSLEQHLSPALAALRTAVDARDLSAALTHLVALVPDYTPSDAVLTLAGLRTAR
jgi:FlaA1/EpsC-like NDP-sugar epimerase